LLSHATQSKIRDLYLVELVKEDVLRFQIAVYDWWVFVVDKVHAFGDLHRDSEPIQALYRTAVDCFGEIPALRELRYNAEFFINTDCLGQQEVVVPHFHTTIDFLDKIPDCLFVYFGIEDFCGDDVIAHDSAMYGAKSASAQLFFEYDFVYGNDVNAIV
jgi:hypothetical protein